MENNTIFSARSIIKESFELARKNFWSYAAVIATFFILGMIDPNQKNYPGSGLISLFTTLASIYISICALAATLKIVNGDAVTVKDFFNWPKNGFKTFFTNIVSSLVYVPLLIVSIIIIGSFALIFLMGGGVHVSFEIFIWFLMLLPTIYFGIRIMFAKYYSLEFGHMPGKAIKEAWKASSGHFWLIFKLVILSALIAVLGIIALFVGIFWAAPTVIIAQVMLYKKISNKNGVLEENKSLENLPEVQPLELQANTAPEAVNAGVNN